MKQHNTKVFRALSFFYLGFPLTYLPAAVYLFDIPIPEVPKIILEPAFLLVSVLSAITGLGLYEMKRWGWYALQFTQIFVVLYSITILLRHSQTQHPWIALAVAIVLLRYIRTRLSREVRVPYFMPQISWWESDPKYRTQIPARVVRADGSWVECEILDLSVAGCFIRCKPTFILDERVEVQATLFGRSLVCGGIVVWKTFGAVTHPRGIGVKFGGMERGTRRVLKAATIKIKKISKLNRRGRYWLSTDDYRKSLAKLSAPLPRGEDER